MLFAEPISTLWLPALRQRTSDGFPRRLRSGECGLAAEGSQRWKLSTCTTIPNSTRELQDSVSTTYEHLSEEIHEAGYTDDEIALIRDPMFYYGRFLNPSTRAYALNTVVTNVVPAIRHLGIGDDGTPKRIVDLGCGLGMQSIIFATLGARVLGLDLQERCIDLCRKRKEYYESILGRPLDIEFVAGDFSEMELGAHTNYDGLLSMPAFAHIHPLDRTVRRISGLLAPEARVCLWDQNPSFLFRDRFGGNRAGLPTTRAIEHEFRLHGFHDHLIRGGTAVPHQMWSLSPLRPILARVDRWLTRSTTLSFSYVIMSQR